MKNHAPHRLQNNSGTKGNRSRLPEADRIQSTGAEVIHNLSKIVGIEHPFGAKIGRGPADFRRTSLIHATDARVDEQGSTGADHTVRSAIEGQSADGR